MDPITTVLLVATWITARSGEGFAVEFGKDAYENAKHLVSRLISRIAYHPNSESLIDEIRSDTVDEKSRARFSEIIRTEPDLQAEISSLTNLLKKRQPESYLFVSQDNINSHDIVGIKGSNDIPPSRAEQRNEQSTKIIGIDLTGKSQ